MAQRYDLILFDLDGTLSEPQLGIGRSLNYALRHFGFPELSPLEISTCIGPPLDVSFRAITGISETGPIMALIDKYRERYGEIGYAENELYPGIKEALAALYEAGIPLAVCTSKRLDFAEQVLQLFELHGYFRFISGGEIGTAKWQQMAQLKEEGRLAERSLMIGDRAVDLITAHRNGLDGAGVLWGHGSREELEQEKPHYLLREPAELLTHFLA